MGENQSSLGNLVPNNNPDTKLFGIQSATVEKLIKSKDGKIVAMDVNIELKGPVKTVTLTNTSSRIFIPPQVGDKVLIAFVNGNQQNPIFLTSQYPFMPESFGSNEKEAFIKLPNGVKILTDAEGNVQITAPGIITIAEPEDEQKAARKGDKTEGHQHIVPFHTHAVVGGSTTTITWTPTPGQDGQTDEVQDTINEGSDKLKIGD